MKHILSLALAACLATPLAVNAQSSNELTVLPVADLADPAGPRSDASVAPTQVRALSLEQTQVLLKSTEGAAWHVLQVQAPKCEKGQAKKECKQKQAECKAADKFAHKFKLHAACSALYIQTTVLLTNQAVASKAAVDE